MKTNLITGLFGDQIKAQQASDLLRQNGFSSNDITGPFEDSTPYEPVHNPDWETSTTAKRDLVTDIAKDLDPGLGSLVSSISDESSPDAAHPKGSNFMVKVNTTDPQSVLDAAQILDKSGALHIQVE